MELPGGDDEWLAPSPSPPGPAVPDRHDEHGVGTFIWPPVGTSTWPPVGTFSWPRTDRGWLVGINGQFNTIKQSKGDEMMNDLEQLAGHDALIAAWWQRQAGRRQGVH